MVFNSIVFFIFLPIVFAFYWLLQGRLRWQNFFIVAASYLFYGWWDWRFLILIAFTSFCSWGSGLLISRSAAMQNGSRCSFQSPDIECVANVSVGGKLRTTLRNFFTPQVWMWINIVINLGILGVFKYYNFFLSEFYHLFGLGDVASSRFFVRLILPVGISFYTFQALSYSIDVYRQKIEPTRDWVSFFAYVSFFPQLVAGPIERATNLLPQFERPRRFDYADAVEGCRRILWGLFKKVVVADNCALYVDRVWANIDSQSASTLVLASVLFAFQIYGDFSGYSDIAIGTAKLFGIRLRDNFLTPYFSRNVAEFWKRWHISLNTWFVDYVYIPLGGNREGKIKTVCNTFVIFLLSGLWHGANWTYLSWGIYHALLFVPLIFLGLSKKYHGVPSLSELPQMFLTFVLVVIGWILFRAPSVHDAWHFVLCMCDSSLFSIPWLMVRQWYIPLFVSICLMLVCEWLGREEGYGLAFMRNKPKALQLLVYYVLVILIYLWQSTEDIQFIYFQF